MHQSTIPSLTWTASQYAAEQAYCYDTSDNDVCDTSWKAGGTRADLSGLSKGTTYYWQVRAANSADTVYADSGAWWSFTTVGDADLNHWTGKAAGEVHDPQLRPLILCDPHEAGFLRETRLRGVPRAWARRLTKRAFCGTMGRGDAMKIFLPVMAKARPTFCAKFQPRAEAPLTPPGREQAAGLAAALEGRSITIVYSSPVLRAIETSVIVAHHLGVEYEVREALREVDVGNLEGRSDEEAWRQWRSCLRAGRTGGGGSSGSRAESFTTSGTASCLFSKG